MSIWEYIQNRLEAGGELALLYVIDSDGSSPGRQGFSMVVPKSEEMFGSIGGGFMEHKLVELARAKMDGSTGPFLKKQIHRKDAKADQSGMICSGEQEVAFYFLSSRNLEAIRGITMCVRDSGTGILNLSQKGLDFYPGEFMDSQYSLEKKDEDHWSFREQIGHKNTLYILGGGHVGVALSEVMSRLGFYVVVMDNREGLNTMEGNKHAHKKVVVEFGRIADFVPEGSQTFIALVSFGYRTDKLLLSKLAGRNFAYLGMLGSEEKVRKLIEELIAEGVSMKALAKVHAPIGIPIHSKTPQEIAISIAAEMIQVKNK